MAASFWKVVGGADKGGILVRTGQDTSSSTANERLSTGAFVKELDLQGERLQYFRLTGTGPSVGWVSCKLKSSDLLTQSSTIWEVVGGTGKGGIVVRKDVDTTSAELPERLSTGALVREVELTSSSAASRLHFQRLTGSGPDLGWVSQQFKGNALVVEAGKNSTKALEALVTQVEAQQDLVKALPFEEGVPAELNMPYADYISDYIKRLLAGEIVGPIETYPSRAHSVKGAAPGRPQTTAADSADADFEVRRLQVQATSGSLGLGNARRVPPWKRLGKKDLLGKATHVMNGDLYGIPVPPTLDELERMGAKWLTNAFLAAGTLQSGNSVKRIVELRRLPTTTVDAAGGQGPKAFLTVEYELPDASLHYDLFVKMPWAADGGTIEAGVDIAHKGADDYPEIAFYLYMGPLVPFKMPKLYFAELCRENTNSIIIIERFKFGKKDQISFEPYQVLPLAEKYFDHQLMPLQRCEMYYAIMRAQARLAAWYHLGHFDKAEELMQVEGSPPPHSRSVQVVGNFEWPSKLPEKQREAKRKSAPLIWGFWEKFLGVAKQCYPPEFSEPKFCDALKSCIEDFVTYSDDLNKYSNLFPEYIAVQHPNLNADNACFWWTSGGRMDCAIFDFGFAQPFNFCRVLTGSITGADGEVLFEHDVHLLKCFRDELYRECGLKLNLGEVRRQWHLEYGLYLIYLALQINTDVLTQCPPDEWATISTLWDPRVVNKWNVRCYTFMIKIALRYLYMGWVKGGRKRLSIHDTLLEWKAYWEQKGLT